MKDEILSLNLLRFFAALNVLCVHKFEQLLSIGYLPSFLKVLSPFTQYGYLGVDLFFIISGFVITFSSDGRTVKHFVLARFIRLFPVFWICVSVTTLIIAVFSLTQHISLSQYLANLTMAPVYFGNNTFIDGSYWSLGVELKFYLFIAFLLFLKSLFKIDIQNVAIFFSILLMIQSVFFMTVPTSFFGSLTVTWLFYFWNGYAHYFMAGILFYGIYQNNKRDYNYLAIFLCYVVAIIQAFNKSYATDNKTILTLYITLFFGLFFLISLRKVTNESFYFLGKNYRKIIISLGAITYPLYLLHNVTSQVIIESLTLYKIPAYFASPLLVFIILLLIVLVNRIDFYISGMLKQKLLHK